MQRYAHGAAMRLDQNPLNQTLSTQSVVSHASRKKEHHGERRSRAQAAHGTHTRLAIYGKTAAAVVCLSSALPVTAGSGRASTSILGI